MVPWPEIIMTSGGLSSSRILARVSRPSTPGSQMSSSTTSNGLLPSASRQASPLSTAEEEYPSSVRMPANESRMPASSSTIRMLGMLDGRGRGRGFRHYGEFHNEASTHRTIFLDPNRAMMIFHDAAHDGKAEAGAALLGREIRKEKLFFDFARDPVTRVGNRDLDCVTARNQGG